MVETNSFFFLSILLAAPYRQSTGSSIGCLVNSNSSPAGTLPRFDRDLGLAVLDKFTIRTTIPTELPDCKIFFVGVISWSAVLKTCWVIGTYILGSPMEV